MGDQSEKTLFRTKHSIAPVLRDCVLAVVAALYGYLLLSLMPEATSDQRLEGLVLSALPLWHLVRYLRTSLTITEKRLIYATGFLSLRTKEVALKEIDLQRLQNVGVTSDGGIVDIWGERFPTTFVDNPLHIYDELFKVLRLSDEPKIDKEVIRHRGTRIWWSLAGAATFLPIWPLVMGRILDFNDLNHAIPGLILSFIAMPTLVGIGAFLGAVVALLWYPRILTPEQAVRVFELDLHPGMSKFDRWMWTSCNGTYERILSWRYGQPIKLPR